MDWSLPRWLWIHRQREYFLADPNNRDQVPNRYTKGACSVARLVFTFYFRTVVCPQRSAVLHHSDSRLPSRRSW